MSRPGGVIGVGLIMALTAASTAGAQTYVGKNVEGGMHWAVSAPQGASWLLTCRFPPVTYWESAYDQNHWINKLERPGEGSDRGRLPLNVGHCHVTKTGGRGPVGVALVREPREVRAEGTAVTGRRIGVGFL
jgi:hypothetical protein